MTTLLPAPLLKSAPDDTVSPPALTLVAPGIPTTDPKTPVASPTTMLMTAVASFKILATMETAFDESRIPTSTSLLLLEEGEEDMASFAASMPALRISGATLDRFSTMSASGEESCGFEVGLEKC